MPIQIKKSVYLKTRAERVLEKLLAFFLVTYWGKGGHSSFCYSGFLGTAPGHLGDVLQKEISASSKQAQRPGSQYLDEEPGSVMH